MEEVRRGYRTSHQQSQCQINNNNFSLPYVGFKSSLQLQNHSQHLQKISSQQFPTNNNYTHPDQYSAFLNPKTFQQRRKIQNQIQQKEFKIPKHQNNVTKLQCQQLRLNLTKQKQFNLETPSKKQNKFNCQTSAMKDQHQQDESNFKTPLTNYLTFNQSNVTPKFSTPVVNHQLNPTPSTKLQQILNFNSKSKSKRLKQPYKLSINTKNQSNKIEKKLRQQSP